jgi:hypothetical protein
MDMSVDPADVPKNIHKSFFVSLNQSLGKSLFDLFVILEDRRWIMTDKLNSVNQYGFFRLSFGLF